MSARERALLLTPSLPDPKGSGLQQRAFHLLRDLAQQHPVDLIVVGRSSSPPSPEVTQLATEIHFVDTQPLSTWKRRTALLFPPLLHLLPGWAADWPQIHHLPPALSLRSVSHLIVFRMRTHACLRALLQHSHTALRTTLDIDDVESGTLRSIGLRALRRGRLRLAVQTLTMFWQYHILERRILHGYTEVSFSNPADEPFLARLSGPARLLLRPNRVSLQPLRSDSPPPAPFTLLFLGTLNYFPNVDAALWIAAEIVPALRQHLNAPFRILIAGRDAEEPLIASLRTVPEILYLGPVDDVDPLYRQAHVALAAVRCGGGTKVKVLEAAARGCPAVTTPHCLLGLPFTEGTEILAGSTAAEIAQCCARLQSDTPLARSISAAAYRRLAGSLSCADAEGAAERSLPPSNL